MPVTGRSTHDGRESWRQRMAATPQPNNNPTTTQPRPKQTIRRNATYVCRSETQPAGGQPCMDPAILQTRPAARGRRGRTVLREQHHGPHHPPAVRTDRGPRHHPRPCGRTDPTMRHDARLHHRARGLALRRTRCGWNVSAKLRIPPGERRIRKSCTSSTSPTSTTPAPATS